MSTPIPDVKLQGHCSVVHDGTLYVYSSAAFQSINLKEGAQWKELEMDVAASGAACVKGTPNGDPAQTSLYIVGGTTDPSIADYTGLQRYIFSEKRWERVTPLTLVTLQRQHHGAVFLNATSQILVYAGSQTPGESGLSSSTFVIRATEPFDVQSYQSAAPPLVSPLLMQWNDSHAVMVGGDPTSRRVFTFGPNEGWSPLSVELAEPIADQTTTQCTIAFGDDGSKVLETYKMGVSPNVVSRIALLGARGQPATAGQAVGGPAAKRKRAELSIQNWPSYNDTFAPNVTRTGFSIAQDENGVALISGGNADDPLSIFDERKNSWVNATEFFEGQSPVVMTTDNATSSSSFLASATSTAPASASTTAASSGSSDHKSRMLTVLGATLGAIFGIAALLIIILLLLRWKREKRRRAAAEGYLEKDRLSFADRGAEFMSEAGGSMGQKYNMTTNHTNHSSSSLAIISGKAPGHKRGIGPLGSDSSTTRLVKQRSPLGFNDPVEMNAIHEKPPQPTPADTAAGTQQPPPAAADSSATAVGLSRSRSSGWSRYFANNEATNLAHMPSGRSTYASDRTSGASQSEYTDSRMYSQPSQTVPPLDLNFHRFEGQRFSQVAHGSPTLGNSQEDLRGTGLAVSQPMQAELARAGSNSSTGSSRGDGSHLTSGTAIETTSWTPVSRDDFNQRPPSSSYTASNLGAEAARDNTSSYYPNDGSSSYYPKSPKSPKSTNSSYYLNSGFFPSRAVDPRYERTSTVTVFPRGQEIEQAPADASNRIDPPHPIKPNEDRGSTVTVFPRGVPEKDDPAEGSRQRQIGHQDMSWLNLGAR